MIILFEDLNNRSVAPVGPVGPCGIVRFKIKLGDDEDNILKISADESDNEDMNNNHNQEEDDEMNGTLHNIHNELDA